MRDDGDGLEHVLSDEAVRYVLSSYPYPLSASIFDRFPPLPSPRRPFPASASAVTDAFITLTFTRPSTEMLRRSAERTMQAMVAAVFSRLRVLPSSAEEDPSSLALHSSLSSSVSLTDSMAPVDPEGGLRMLPPDPRGAHIPAAGEGESAAHDEEALDEGELEDGTF